MKILSSTNNISLLIEFFKLLQPIKGFAELKYRPGKNTTFVLEVDINVMGDVYDLLEKADIALHCDHVEGNHYLTWGEVNAPKLKLTFDVSKVTKTILIPLDVDMIPHLQGLTVDDLDVIHTQVNSIGKE